MSRLHALSPAVLLLVSSLAVSFVPEEATRATARAEEPVLTVGPGPAGVPTGILRDRVLSFARIDEHDGSPGAPLSDATAWRQMLHEMTRASFDPPTWPDQSTLRSRSETAVRGGVIPIGVLNVRYAELRTPSDAPGGTGGTDGAGTLSPDHMYAIRRAFAASSLHGYTYRGEDVVFTFGPSWYVTNDPSALAAIAIDFDDGKGYRLVREGSRIHVGYAVTGTRAIRVRADLEDGTTLHAGFRFEVRALRAPAPHDTLAITATIPYLGELGTGEAYVYRSDLNPVLTNPIVVVEGLDLENSMNWDELYALLNRENLLEIARAEGFDAVVLNFTDATDYVQRNSLVVVELLQQVRDMIPPENTSALVGASMGGVAGRLALAFMETNAIEHDVRTFISFDSPQRGADIPLGIQYWVWFFADDSVEAGEFLAALDSPAARQLLVYHHTDPPSATAGPDPLRAGLLADLAAGGEYPTLPRLVAVANGSGNATGQGFAPAAQIIEWEYGSLLVDIIGNVWAVPDGGPATIFHGLIDIILLPPEEITVAVGGTQPYDNCPGGWRPSMAQMDSVAAPYGDIIALHDNHAFIPTVSALDLDTADLFHDVLADPNILDITPFDAVYVPAENQEHVAVTPENVNWLLDEIRMGVIAVAGAQPAGARMPLLSAVWPNPTRDATRIRFALPDGAPARLAVYDLRGRQLTEIAAGRFPAGETEVVWDGRTASGHRAGSGVYFLTLQTPHGRAARTVTVR